MDRRMGVEDSGSAGHRVSGAKTGRSCSEAIVVDQSTESIPPAKIVLQQRPRPE